MASVRLIGKRKPGGITPTIVYRRPSSLTFDPTASGFASKTLRQTSSLSTATLLRPASSSPGSNTRPIAGFTPKTSKKFALAATARRDTAPDGSSALTPRKLLYAANAVNDFISRRQSTYSG